MEVLFENRFMMTKQEIRDFFLKHFRCKYTSFLWLAVALPASAVSVVSILRETSVFPYAFLAIFCGYMGLSFYRSLASNTYKQLSILQGASEWEMRTQISEEIAVACGKSQARYQWGQITRVRDRNGYILLYLQKSVFLRLRKDAFTKGDPEAFFEYVRSEHPGVRVDAKKRISRAAR